jgi:hypothetical protein
MARGSPDVGERWLNTDTNRELEVVEAPHDGAPSAAPVLVRYCGEDREFDTGAFRGGGKMQRVAGGGR